jgi:hypothetical protein
MLIHAVGSHPMRYIVQLIIVIIFLTKVWNLKDNIDSIYSYVEAKDFKN